MDRKIGRFSVIEWLIIILSVTILYATIGDYNCRAIQEKKVDLLANASDCKLNMRIIAREIYLVPARLKAHCKTEINENKILSSYSCPSGCHYKLGHNCNGERVVICDNHGMVPVYSGRRRKK